MSINWFPGHMITARKKAAESMRMTDLVIEVLDARVPRSSCNPAFEELRRAGQKPALKLLNKSDMADPEQTRLWLRHYNAQPGVQGLALCSKKVSEVDRILPACRALRPDRGRADKPLRMMILGIPNVGTVGIGILPSTPTRNPLKAAFVLAALQPLPPAPVILHGGALTLSV